MANYVCICKYGIYVCVRVLSMETSNDVACVEPCELQSKVCKNEVNFIKKLHEVTFLLNDTAKSLRRSHFICI